jgi:hypothetical protein
MKTKKMAFALVLIASATQIALSSYSMIASFSEKKEETPRSVNIANSYGLSAIRPLTSTLDHYSYGTTRLNQKMEDMKNKIQIEEVIR